MQAGPRLPAGFFDNILPLLVGEDVNALSITIRGSGQVRHPFTLRYDIGRVLAATFERPLEYKDTWITVVNACYTLEEVAHKVEQFTGRDWKVRKIPTDMKMPILHLAEENGWDILPLVRAKRMYLSSWETSRKLRSDNTQSPSLVTNQVNVSYHGRTSP